MPVDVARAKEHTKYHISRQVGPLVEKCKNDGTPIQEHMTESGLIKAPNFPMRCAPKDIAELGVGFPIFLEVYKMVTLFIGIIFICYIPAMAIVYGDAENNDLNGWGDPSFYVKYVWTMCNVQKGSIANGWIPGTTFFATFLGFMLCGRMYLRVVRVAQECDNRATHPNDFALLVRGLPRASERQVANFFQKRYRSTNTTTSSRPTEVMAQNQSFASTALLAAENHAKPYVTGYAPSRGLPQTDRESDLFDELHIEEWKVLRVIVGYDMTQFSDTVEKMKECHDRIELLDEGFLEPPCCGGLCSCCRTAQFDPTDEAISMRREEVEADLAKYEEKFESYSNLHESELKDTGFAVVVFENQKDFREALDFWVEGLWPTLSRKTGNIVPARTPVFDGHQLYVERAPNPSDIMWKNLHVSKKERAIWLLLTSLLFLAILLCSGIAVYGLVTWNINMRESTGDPDEDEGMTVIQFLWRMVLSFLPSWMISGVNAVMYIVVDFAVAQERHPTATSMHTSGITKLTTFLIFNKACVYLIVHTIYAKNQESWFTVGGLVENVFTIYLWMIFFDPFYYMIDPFGRIPRWWARIFVSPKKSKKTQQNYEKMWEAPEFPTHEKYSYMLSYSVVTLIYLPIFPFCGILAVIALFVNYWANKWLLLRYNKRPYEQGDILGKRTLQLLQIFLCLMPGLTFVLVPPGHSSSALTYSLGIAGTVLCGVVAFFIPYPVQQRAILLNYFRKVEEEDFGKAITYYEAQHNFTDDYHRNNPIYSSLPEWRVPSFIHDPESTQPPSESGDDTDEEGPKVNFRSISFLMGDSRAPHYAMLEQPLTSKGEQPKSKTNNIETADSKWEESSEGSVAKV